MIFLMFLLILIAIGCTVLGLFFVLTKRRRLKGKRLLGVALAAIIAAAAAADYAMEVEAREAGFESHDDQERATTFGITDPAIWKNKKAEMSAEDQRLATAKAEIERRKGFHCLSQWDGAHTAFKNDIVKRLRDPDSFKHVETRVTPVSAEGTHQLYMTYRATNGFGGVNTGVAKGSFDNTTCRHLVITVE